jgi:hypothetical protein
MEAGQPRNSPKIAATASSASPDVATETCQSGFAFMTKINSKTGPDANTNATGQTLLNNTRLQPLSLPTF